MLVGIDAHHDPDMRSGSVAVLVATTDKEMAHYVSFCEPQNIHTELFDGLQVCMLKALTRYYKTNILPCAARICLSASPPTGTPRGTAVHPTE